MDVQNRYSKNSNKPENLLLEGLFVRNQIIKRFKEFNIFPNGLVSFDQSVHVVGSSPNVSAGKQLMMTTHLITKGGNELSCNYSSDRVALD